MAVEGVRGDETIGDVLYSDYHDETELPRIMELVQRDLSEPYSIFTYRYFIQGWPSLCHLARCDGKIVGVIVCRQKRHKSGSMRGYIAMIAVDSDFRMRHIGSNLVRRAVSAIKDAGADEVVLEAEVSNTGAIRLYEKLGFLRDKKLPRYYLQGTDAWRLKLWLK